MKTIAINTYHSTLAFILLICFHTLTSCTDNNKPIHTTNVIEPRSVSIPFTWTLDHKNLIGDTIIAINFDPLAKTKKRYKAYPLKENLAQVIPNTMLQDSLQLIFHCTDGYSPSIPLSTLNTHRAFLAYADTKSLEDNKHWPDSLADKYHPFYIIWTTQSNSHTLPWAYGVFELKLDHFQDEYKLAFPKSEAYVEGFNLFQENCIKCHSINKTGGQVGPEFNVPKNITEYWKKKDIWAFINDPQSYRYNSKMPKIEGLDSNAFNKIYDYLKYMKNQKVINE